MSIILYVLLIVNVLGGKSFYPIHPWKTLFRHPLSNPAVLITAGVMELKGHLRCHLVGL